VPRPSVQGPRHPAHGARGVIMPGVFGPTNFRRNTRPLACTGTGHRERPPVRHAGSPNPIGIGDRHGVLSASGVVGVYPVASGLLVGEDRSPSASGHRCGPIRPRWITAPTCAISPIASWLRSPRCAARSTRITTPDSSGRRTCKWPDSSWSPASHTLCNRLLRHRPGSIERMGPPRLGVAFHHYPSIGPVLNRGTVADDGRWWTQATITRK